MLSPIGEAESIMRKAANSVFSFFNEIPWMPASYKNDIKLVADMDYSYYGETPIFSFGRWKNAADNDLASVLFFLQAIDYLKLYPESSGKRIFLADASRGGPPALIAAALRPKQVCGVALAIPTSCGISWKQKPYQGWGMLPAPYIYQPKSPTEAIKIGKQPKTYIKRFTSISAYVDPVNHAEDLKAPLVVAYAIDDPLSPPQGTEALYHLAGSSWKRISRDSGVHQINPGFVVLLNELAKKCRTQ